MYSNMYSNLGLITNYKHDTPQIGDCMIKNNKAYIYGAKDEWIEIGYTNTNLNDTIYNTTARAEYRPHRLKRKTCSACGAPMHGYICEYCGSEYY